VIKIEKGFKLNRSNELVYLTIPSFEHTKLVKHCFTTRVGGVSKGIYSSLNTSPLKEDPVENVLKNLDAVCSAVDIDYRKLVLPEQTHEDNIRIVTEKDIGKGLTKTSDIKNTDGLMTNIPGIPLITFYADCVPLFFLDTKKKVIALVHSGWKGTVQKIGAKAINMMKEVYGTCPCDCLAGIGPSIGMDCFEIGMDAAQHFMDSFENWTEFMAPFGDIKYKVDLWKANKLILQEQGIPEENITISGYCTKCNEDLFFSYRRDKGRTGSLSAIMELI
jgi:YfiH family protein